MPKLYNFVLRIISLFINMFEVYLKAHYRKLIDWSLNTKVLYFQTSIIFCDVYLIYKNNMLFHKYCQMKINVYIPSFILCFCFFSVLRCLEARYLTDNICSKAGITLIVVNPFKSIPGMYEPVQIKKYYEGNCKVC